MYERNPHKLRNTNSLLNFPTIPEKILFDQILARLPVKSLSRFKCVSKPWLSLIESDRFIKIHYRNSAKNPRVVMFDLRGERMSGSSLQWLLNVLKEGTDDPTKTEPKEGVPVGCFNGVVCCYGRGIFSLWNPATRVSVELAPHNRGEPSVLIKYGFGWNDSTGAYKVFAVFSDYKRFPKTGIVYSSSTNSWRTISSGGSVNLFCECGVFLRGNLHWVDTGDFQVECFDLEMEEFRRIELPLKGDVSKSGYVPWLGVIGGSLALLAIDLEKGFEVWVMKEYGVKDSWLKILTFPSLFRPIKHATYPLFGEGPNGETFVVYGETLIIYSPKDDALSANTNDVDFSIASVYIESLVSPRRMILDATGTS